MAVTCKAAAVRVPPPLVTHATAGCQQLLGTIVFDVDGEAPRWHSRCTRDGDMSAESKTQWRSVVSRDLDVDVFQPLSAAVRLETAAASTCGKLRAINTDHYLAIRLGRTQETLLTSLKPGDLPPRFEESAYALLVADGLGDRGSGARASRVALSALAHLAIRYGRWNVRLDTDSLAGTIEQGEFLWRRAHDAVVKEARAHLQLADMATSLTALYIAGADMFFAHTGHSRAYLFRDGTLIQLTSDHTFETTSPHQGNGSPPQYAKSDLTHDVTDVIGGRTEPRVDIERVQLADGDRLLLCTNGLTDAISSDDIAAVLALQRRPSDDCSRLTQLAVAARAADDVTVLVADYRLRV